MITPSQNIQQLRDNDNRLQHSIDHLTHIIHSKTQQQKPAILYQDDYFSLQIDQTGHQIAKIKTEGLVRNPQSAQLIQSKQERKQKQRALIESVQMYKLQSVWLRNQYLGLIQFLKLKKIYATLPACIIENCQKIQQSNQLTNNQQESKNTCYGNQHSTVKGEVQASLKTGKQIIYISKPMYIEVQRIKQIPVMVEKIKKVQIIKEVPLIVERRVQVPVDRIVERNVFLEKIVEVPIYIQKRVEVPSDKIIEKTVEVIVERQIEIPVERVVQVEVEKIVEVPVQQLVFVEILVEVPVEKIVYLQKEKIVEVQRIIQIPVQRVVEVQVQKIVEVPIQRIVQVTVQKIVEVPIEKIVEVKVQTIVQVPVQKIIQVTVQKLVQKEVFVQRVVQVIVPFQIIVETQNTVYIETAETLELKQENQLLKAFLFQLRQDYEQLENSLDFPVQKYNRQKLHNLIEHNRRMKQNILKYEQDQQETLIFRDFMKKQIEAIAHRNQQLFDKLITKDQSIENHRKTINALQEYSLSSKKDIQDLNKKLKHKNQQNQRLVTALEQIQKQLEKCNQQNQALQDVISNIESEKQRLNSLLQHTTAEIELTQNMQILLDEKDQEVQTLHQKNQYYAAALQKMQKQLRNAKNKYREQKQQNHQQKLLIEQLTNTNHQLQQELLVYPHINQSNILSNKNFSKEDNSQSILEHSLDKDMLKNNSSACPINRVNYLSREIRQNTLSQIKKLVGQTSNSQVSKKLLFLLQKVDRDIDYKSRTNIKLKQMVLNLKQQLSTLSSQSHETKSNILHSKHEQYVDHLENSIKKYQILLNKAEDEKTSILAELQHLYRQNQLLQSNRFHPISPDKTEDIQELQIQTQQLKAHNQNLRAQNQELRGELVDLENELVDKNNKIKLLAINLYLRQTNGYSVQQQTR